MAYNYVYPRKIDVNGEEKTHYFAEGAKERTVSVLHIGDGVYVDRKALTDAELKDEKAKAFDRMVSDRWGKNKHGQDVVKRGRLFKAAEKLDGLINVAKNPMTSNTTEQADVILDFLQGKLNELEQALRNTKPSKTKEVQLMKV